MTNGGGRVDEMLTFAETGGRVGGSGLWTPPFLGDIW